MELGSNSAVDTSIISKQAGNEYVAHLEQRVASLEARLSSMESVMKNAGLCADTLKHRDAAGSGLVYIGMSADIMHCGHANIIRIGKSLGKVVVGLLTDEAIASYKRETIIKYEERKALVEAFQGVDLVVPQTTLDYRPNLEWLKPAFVVHGNDWSDPSSAQYKTRQDVADCLAQWGGQLIEPPYTGGISTTDIIKRCRES